MLTLWLCWLITGIVLSYAYLVHRRERRMWEQENCNATGGTVTFQASSSSQKIVRAGHEPVPIEILMQDESKIVQSFEWHARSEFPPRCAVRMLLADGRVLDACMSPRMAHSMSDDALRAAAKGAKRDGEVKNAGPLQAN